VTGAVSIALRASSNLSGCSETGLAFGMRLREVLLLESDYTINGKWLNVSIHTEPKVGVSHVALTELLGLSICNAMNVSMAAIPSTTRSLDEARRLIAVVEPFQYLEIERPVSARLRRNGWVERADMSADAIRIHPVACTRGLDDRDPSSMVGRIWSGTLRTRVSKCGCAPRPLSAVELTKVEESGDFHSLGCSA